MNVVIPSKTDKPSVLITGIKGFTGKYLKDHLNKQGYTVYGLVQPHTNVCTTNEFACDITDYQSIAKILTEIKPDYIIHLAAISFVGHQNIEEMYRVNIFGALNILQALIDLNIKPKKILIASSANVYGNPTTEIIDENCCPLPVNHYANSKLAMENMVRTYFPQLPIIITRPFNYTGIGQRADFLIPKMVAYFKRREKVIELGNIDVIRDFSSVHFVVDVYYQLLISTAESVIVNVCSGQGYSLQEILAYLEELANYQITVQVNPKLVRANEIKKLIGDNKLLFKLIGEQKKYPFFEVVREMYQAG